MLYFSMNLLNCLQILELFQKMLPYSSDKNKGLIDRFSNPAMETILMDKRIWLNQSVFQINSVGIWLCSPLQFTIFPSIPVVILALHFIGVCVRTQVQKVFCAKLLLSLLYLYPLLSTTWGLPLLLTIWVRVSRSTSRNKFKVSNNSL